MSLISILHSRRKPWALAVLTVFVLVWLNLTLQQCVLAASVMSDSSLPPAAYPLDDCPNCVTLGEAGCNYEVGCEESTARMSNISITVKKEIQPEYVMMIPPVYRAIPEQEWDSVTSDSIPPASPPSAGPSLNVRYCVYLK